MTDEEYDLLDELYFVIDFVLLKRATGLDDKVLIERLQNLVEKGWVRAFVSPGGADAENPDSVIYPSLYYLASKDGLLAHTGL
ncbi:MAG: hypothetical protein V4543_10825 [Bacteroidota bacterium]